MKDNELHDLLITKASNGDFVRGRTMRELQDGAIKHEMHAREVFGEEKDEWWKRADAAYSEFPPIEP